MKRAAVVAVLFSLAAPARADVPSIDHPVNDYAGVLTRAEKAEISDALIQERANTGVQIAVLIVRTTGVQPIEDYAIAVAEAWGGGSAERSDGVLLVLAIDDRRMRIEVGYDLEDRLTDGRSRQILEEMKNGLRRGDYGGAIAGAVDNIRRVTSGLEPVVTYRPEPAQQSSGCAGGCQSGGVVALIIVFMVAVTFLGLMTGGGSSGGSSSGWSSGSSFSSWSSSSSSSSSSSTSWSGGGGSFGGGGASSGW